MMSPCMLRRTFVVHDMILWREPRFTVRNKVNVRSDPHQSAVAAVVVTVTGAGVPSETFSCDLEPADIVIAFVYYSAKKLTSSFPVGSIALGFALAWPI